MRRALKRAAMAIAGLAIAGGIAAWTYRIPLVTWVAMRVLEQMNLGPVRIVIDKVGPHAFEARDLSLRGGALQAEEVSATYDPLELVTLHVRRVMLTGLKVSLAAGANGIEIGRGAPGISPSTSNGLSGSLVHVDALVIPNAELVLESPAGPFRATVSTELELTETSIRGSALSGQLSGAISGTPYAAQFEARAFSLEPRADGGTRLSLSQAAFVPSSVPWTAETIDGEIGWQSDNVTARLSVGRLADQHRPMAVAPLALTANITMTEPRIEFVLSVNSEAAPAASMEIKGRHDRSANSGSATIAMQPVAFRPGGLQPGDLFPALGRGIADAAGAIAVDGTLRWDRSGLSPNLVVHLEDLGFAMSGAKLRAINGAIRLNRLWPPATPSGQSLSATIETAGLPPAQVRLAGQLTPSPALKIEHAAIGFAAGDVTATPFVIDPRDPRFETTLDVSAVDLAEIIKLLNIDALSGTGQLDGRIPVSLQNGKIIVTAGRLAARGPGLLSYRPDKVPEQIAAAGESVALAMQALGDFHYESLTFDLDKAPNGEGTVLLRLEGRNPAVLQGQPFRFNIRIDSNFDRLVDYALLSLSSTEELLRRALRGTKP